MKRSLNLLTPRFRLRMLVRRRLWQWGIACAMVAVISLAWAGYRALALQGLRDQAAAQQTIAAPLLRLHAESARLRGQLDSVHRRQSLLALLGQGKLPYQVLAVVSRSARQCDGQIQVRELALSREEIETPDKTPPKRPAAPETKPETEDRVRLTLKGVAADNLAVARFVTVLRESAVFEQVDLKSALQGNQFLQPTGRSYWVECVLEGI